MKTIFKSVVIIALAVLMLAPMATAKEYGPFLGSAGLRDTVTIAEIYNWLGATSAVGKYLYCSASHDGAAPQNECALILQHTQTSGLIIIDAEVQGAGNDAVLGFSADLNTADVLWVMDTPPAGALLRTLVTATQPATGVEPVDMYRYISDGVDSSHAGIGDRTDATAPELSDGTESAISLLRGLVDRNLAFIAVVDANCTGNTAFGDASFASFPNAWFSTQANWCVLPYDATQTGIEDEIRLITGFVSTGGVFTTADIGAAYTIGDTIYIVPRSIFPEGTALVGRTGDLTATSTPELSDGAETMIGMLRGLIDRNLAYRVVVDGNVTANTAFGDADFSSFPNDWFNTQSNWTAMVFSATQGAIVDEVRLITDFVSTGGVFTTADIGAAYTIGDVIYIVPRALFPEGTALMGRLGDITQAAATGAVTTADNIFGYTKQLVTENQAFANAWTGFASRGTGAAQVDGLDSIYVLSLINFTDNRFNAGAWRLRVLYDAAAGHAAPETQYRDITSVNTTTGLIVCAAFANAIEANDVVQIYDGGAEVLIEANLAAITTVDDYVDTEIGAIDDYVDTEVATIDAIVDSLVSYGERTITYTAVPLAQSTSETLFTIQGSVLISEIIGEISAVIQTGANNMNLQIFGAGTAATDICAVKDIADDAKGNFYTVTGTFANAIAENNRGVPLPGAQAGPIRVIADAAGTSAGTSYLTQTCAASKTGNITWSVRYKPLSQGSVITAHTD